MILVRYWWATLMGAGIGLGVPYVVGAVISRIIEGEWGWAFPLDMIRMLRGRCP